MEQNNSNMHILEMIDLEVGVYWSRFGGWKFGRGDNDDVSEGSTSEALIRRFFIGYPIDEETRTVLDHVVALVLNGGMSFALARAMFCDDEFGYRHLNPWVAAMVAGDDARQNRPR